MSEKLDRINKFGTPFLYVTLVGLCGMAVASIWGLDIWFRVSGTIAAVGGIISVFALIMYSGQKEIDQKGGQL